MKDGKIRITKKENLKGEDGNSVISVRIKKTVLSELDNIAPVSYTHLSIFAKNGDFGTTRSFSPFP